MNLRLAAPAALAVAIAFAAPVLAADEEEETFLKDAISGDIAEIQLGELAIEKGQSEEVREFGRKLVADHSLAKEKATEVATQNDVTPPAEPKPDAQQAYERLSQLSGEAFDREFAKLMVEDHQKHIEMFEEEANSDNSDVAEHAESTLPVLEEHLELAQSIDEGPRG